MRAQTARSLALVGLVLASVAARPVPAQSADTTEPRALEFFEALPGGLAAAALDAIRPTAIAADVRRSIVARLPREGRHTPDAREAAKLAALDPILARHERLGIYTVVAIEVPQAFVANVERTVLLISRRALQLLSSAELQALAAHELGHEFFWEEYQAAANAADDGRLRELELQCDAVAVLTLLDLGLNPAALTQATRKLTDFNMSAGAAANASAYPSLAERARLVRQLTSRLR